MDLRVDLGFIIILFIIVLLSINFIRKRRQRLLHSYSKKRVLEMELRNAIERDELYLHYQPKLSLDTGKITGVEALIRWQHPEKGLISPAEFIPLAEETGLIIPIGEWVLRKACIQNKSWLELGYTPMVVSVNLSVRQLYQSNLIEMVRKILRETELQPEFLELEITESMLMDIQHGIKVLNELKSIGVQVSLDDFGTGYSSLLHLKELPINKLKIDQSFIKNCTEDGKDATIVKTIIAMAHQLNLAVVAEGVETKDHLIFLQRNLCNEGQGYFFSKPIPPEQIMERLSAMEQIIPQNGIPKEQSNQKWLEEALKLAQQELAETLKQQQGMIFKYIKKDEKFIHKICDGELLYRMGLMPEQVIGRQLHDFLSPEAAAEKMQYYQRAWGGEDKVTYDGVRNGVYYIASLRPIRRAGKIVEVIGSCVDITERRQMEDALKRSETQYRLITENMKDLVSVWDIKGKVTYASPSHKMVLGYEHEIEIENLGYSLIYPDDIPLLRNQFHQIISSQTSRQIEFRVKHKDGHWMDVEAQLSPVLEKNKEVEYFVVVGRDISERKKLGELLQMEDSFDRVF